MKFLAAFLILLYTFTGYSQEKNTSITDLDIEKIRRQRDSSMKRMDSLLAASTERMQDQNFQQTMEQNERTLNSFVAEQKERRKRSEKSMWISGSMLVFGIGMSIAGILRRKKKSKSANG